MLWVSMCYIVMYNISASSKKEKQFMSMLDAREMKPAHLVPCTNNALF